MAICTLAVASLPALLAQAAAGKQRGMKGALASSVNWRICVQCAALRSCRCAKNRLHRSELAAALAVIAEHAARRRTSPPLELAPPAPALPHSRSVPPHLAHSVWLEDN